MQYSGYTNLQATPDFANFQFTSPTLPEPTTRQVRFISQQGGQVYLVDFRNRPAEKKEEPNWLESKDFLQTTYTLIQIIEIYSERYPQRILRFRGDTRLKRLLFMHMAVRFEDLLSSLFLFENESPVPIDRDGGELGFVFRISRKPIPFLSVNTVQSTWNGTSRIFDMPFKVEMDKTIRVGMTLPTI